MPEKVSGKDRVREMRRKTPNKYSTEEGFRIVLDGLRGGEGIANLCGSVRANYQSFAIHTCNLTEFRFGAGDAGSGLGWYNLSIAA